MPIHCCLARMPLKCEMRMPIRILSRQHYEPLPPLPLLTTASFARLKFMRPVLSPHSNEVPKHLETKLIAPRLVFCREWLDHIKPFLVLNLCPARAGHMHPFVVEYKVHFFPFVCDYWTGSETFLIISCSTDKVLVPVGQLQG